MIRNHMLLSLFAIIVLSKSVFSAVSVELTMHDDKGACSKYVKEGANYLDIKYVRILQLEDTKDSSFKKVVGNVVCAPTKGTPFLFGNCSQTTGGKGTPVLILAVTAKQQMLSGQIDYRYREEIMKLHENKFLEVSNLDGQSFEPDRHLAVRHAKITGMGSDIVMDMEDCQEQWPIRLIADHGIYMSSKVDGDHVWIRGYYEPTKMGEIIAYQ